MSFLKTNRFTSIFMSIVHVSRQKAVYQGGAENFTEILFIRPEPQYVPLQYTL